GKSLGGHDEAPSVWMKTRCNERELQDKRAFPPCPELLLLRKCEKESWRENEENYILCKKNA
ncbi:MAG: hypothetical protein IKL01_02475, partial [Mailhella sp.]|nr:hypothetical protein [Mailhella sp.]